MVTAEFVASGIVEYSKIKSSTIKEKKLINNEDFEVPSTALHRTLLSFV